MSRHELDVFTDRDLELIAVALSTAIVRQPNVDLRSEYEHALDAVALLQDEGRR